MHWQPLSRTTDRPPASQSIITCGFAPWHVHF